jgi:hypothetical protein
MKESEMAEDFGGRGAALKMVHEDFGPTLKAQVPLELSREDFVRIATESYDLINRLTGCNCLSGLIRYVVDDVYIDVIQVKLGGRG